MNLRDVIHEKDLHYLDVCREVKISPATLFKMYRREDNGIAFGTVKRVCAVVGLSLDEYDRLEECPQSDRYRK
jgi:DNA-binding Xre family transcriptional regulator